MKNFLKEIRSFAINKLAIRNSGDFSYTIKELNGIYKANSNLTKKGLGRFITDDFISHKRSETLFIMGSGPSINDLTDDDVEIIKRHDSVGFNFWLAHDIVPTFYCFQHTRYNKDAIYKLFKHKSQEYKDVPIIVRGSMLSKDPLFCEKMHRTYFSRHNVFFMNEYPIHSKFEGDIDELIEYISNIGLLDFGRIAKFTPKLRGTLGLLICLGYQMGYKKIILCGIDMHDSSHFYDTGKYSTLSQDFFLPEPGVSNILTMEDREHSRNTVSDYVAKISHFMTNEGTSSLFVSSRKSVLAKVIPVWDR